MTSAARCATLDKRWRQAHEKRRWAPHVCGDGREENVMAKGQMRSNREAKKPKKEKPKETAGAERPAEGRHAREKEIAVD